MQDLYELNDKGFTSWMAELWGLENLQDCPEYDIQGSPERSLSRAVIKDGQGNLFVLEKFAKAKYEIRLGVAQTLDYLNRNGLSRALSPVKTRTGEFLPFFGDACFQVTCFLDSTKLPRPQWLESGQIGEEMAVFLIDMQKAAKGIRRKITYPEFSIKAYIYKLFQDMAEYHPKAHAQYLPVLKFLEKEFMDVHDRLVLKFCHGDYHPLNVIWNGQKINAVIDWEFTGIKPDCYDAANLVGCAGIEHPEGLAMPMVTNFLSCLKQADIVSETGWKWFPEYILALRFAWLSEWLRKKDDEMLETEAAYMGILIRHMEELREIWNINE
ncbi:MAG: aminoglycoside phosphotransferase family protein [Desulfobacterales bacterium]|nr:aminoglycoside phosphotransferase family protein [Desulfobacterales bacterium]